MGAIKDIVDLAKDLEASVKDRRDMETIHKIQSLAFSLQSQHADIIERDVGLMQENADLKRQLVESQVEDIRVHHCMEFRKGKRTGDVWMPFCPKCHMPAADSFWYGKSAAVCSARCGWYVLINIKLDTIAKQVGI
jgi:hypothetical protein